ncbi:MAG TPA: ankyrin repeat domain-containing protein [Vicinamibacterales bacterium]|jgi:ankyrin repeat protein|nr:ankyrin repeat domain-containing protein [Vicinamibacterales bacterium]
MRADRYIRAVAALVVALGVPVVLSGADNSAVAFYAALRANDLAALNALIARGESVNAVDAHGITPLMNAAVVGSTEAMARLIDAGADVNAHNEFGSTALMWSATDLAKIQLLIKHGADLNIATEHGRTALWLAAASDGSAAIVRTLIAAGADVRALESTKMTVLHAATMGHDADTTRILIDAGLNVNAADSAGFTPLINAAQRGSVEAVQMLLAKGANANAVTELGDVATHSTSRVKNGALGLGHFTALLLAAPTAPAPLVTALVKAGADVNAKDVRGMTPLMLAVATDHPNLEAIRTLLAAGADVNIRSLAGETALDWARKFGATPVAAVLARAGALSSPIPAVEIPEPAPVAITRAAERGFALMERTSGRYIETGGCAACHAQNITDVAAAAARGKGLRVGGAEAAARLEDATGRFASGAPLLLERLDTVGTPDIPLYSLLALASRSYAPDPMTDAMIANIAAQQYTDGRWHLGGLARPPIQDGDIFRTAFAIRALNVYAPPGRATEMHARVEMAKVWLTAARPVTAEDRNLKLLGLKWAGLNDRQLRPYVKEILADQRTDGGWAQRAELTSDAYATGQTLFALTTAGGMVARDAVCQKGTKYLLSTQRADGSWYVRSRSPKFQPFFESGFPYGHDQWISMMATGWATTALALAIETPRPTRTIP